MADDRVNQDLGPPCLETLMARYQQADAEATRKLIATVSPLLLRFFLADTASRDRAEDLLQDTWLRIHKSRHTYRPGEPVLPWFYAIARHTRVDAYRRKYRVDKHEMQVEQLPECPAAAPEADRLPDLDSLLAVLPASQREVVTMLKISGLSIEEVARATSSSIGSVKQKAHRAYEKLRSVLSESGRAAARRGA
ncbi:MAG: RNA polymerase sigma factor [Bryobacteraceae bacterium]